MLRLAHLPRSLAVSRGAFHTRSLVSSALLSRSWQNESIAELRSEAKTRGLSAKGSKAVLASRIEEYDNSLAFQANVSGVRQASTSAQSSVKSSLKPKENMSGTRSASTISSPSPAQPDNLPEVPGNPELPPAGPVLYLDVTIPDLSQPEPVAPVQVPYLPDFWDSSSSPAVAPLVEDTLPKLLVVAGADTHHGGGPSHNIVDLEASESPKVTQEAAKVESSDSFLDDVAEDLGLPPVKDMKNRLCKLF